MSSFGITVAEKTENTIFKSVPSHPLLSLLLSSYLLKIWKKNGQYLVKDKVCIQAGNLVIPETVVAVKEIKKISLIFRKM